VLSGTEAETQPIRTLTSLEARRVSESMTRKRFMPPHPVRMKVENVPYVTVPQNQ
jgi:hypothetical protein